jgi:hypothetical protein
MTRCFATGEGVDKQCTREISSHDLFCSIHRKRYKTARIHEPLLLNFLKHNDHRVILCNHGLESMNDIRELVANKSWSIIERYDKLQKYFTQK